MLKFLCVLFSLPLMAQVSYDFDNPKLISEFDGELDEISGLSIDPGKHNELLAVQDETGKVYRISSRSGVVLWATEFWKDGDYEGVEAVGDDIWVVKNSGTLYRIHRPGEANQRVDKFNGHLNDENDVEGLAYDAANNRLLLACKSDARDDGNDKDGRYIFSFDLSTNTFSEAPVYSIKRKAVQRFLETCTKTEKHGKLCSFFNEREDYDLSPSALAVHPLTGQLFLTSSVGKVVMVLSAQGQIEYLHKLDKDTYPQPEGLAFAPDGTLFVTTERKKDRPARLYRLSAAK